MDSIKSQLSKLFQHLAVSLDIPESRYKQAEERYQSIGNWLRRDESIVSKYNPDIYTQGSFRLGTVIKPITDEEDYDIDLVCEVSLAKRQVSQKQLKNLVGHEIKNYAHANNMNTPPENRRRCWKQNYADGAQFHMDILPALPDGASFKSLLENKGFSADWTELAIAITDKTLPNYAEINDAWLRSNPKGYAEWFKEQMKVVSKHQREQLVLLEKYASIEDVPDYKVKTPLQRVIQIIKRHRDIMFANDKNDKPVSIIITTLAAHTYNNEFDLLDALLNVVAGMPKYIQTKDGVSWVTNPVNPTENFADKWTEHPQREVKFKKWLQQISDDLMEAVQSEDVHIAGRLLKQHLGEKSINESLKQFPRTKTSQSIPLALSGVKLPSLFNVLHRQRPNWQLSIQSSVKIQAKASRQGFRTYHSENGFKTLDKHYSLRFEVRTNITHPFKVYWQVVNTGNEAAQAKSLRGGFYSGEGNGGLVRYESTLYSGKHWIECFIVKNNVCVARSGEFVINIA